MALPVQYREGGGNLVFNVDYFDWAQNAGYKKYYLGSTKDDTSTKYLLTTDNTLVQPNTDNQIINGTTDNDFDLVFNNAVTVANAVCSINYHVQTAGAMTFTVTFTVYHYDGSTETSLGTATRTTTGTGNENWKECVQFTLTEKKFSKGDTLRVTVATSATGAVGSTPFMSIDPSGHVSYTDQVASTINSTCTINIPFKIQT